MTLFYYDLLIARLGALSAVIRARIETVGAKHADRGAEEIVSESTHASPLQISANADMRPAEALHYLPKVLLEQFS